MVLSVISVMQSISDRFCEDFSLACVELASFGKNNDSS